MSKEEKFMHFSFPFSGACEGSRGWEGVRGGDCFGTAIGFRVGERYWRNGGVNIMKKFAESTDSPTTATFSSGFSVNSWPRDRLRKVSIMH